MSVFVTRWRDAAQRTGWSDPQGWITPAAEHFARALERTQQACPSAGTGRPTDELLAAATTLGAERARDGFYLDEARRDALAAARLADLPDVFTIRVVDALTVAWAETMLTTVRSSQCVDPLTQLCSSAYLYTRIHEVYDECTADGLYAPSEYALTVVHIERSRDRLTTETHMILVQRAMRAVFDGGQTLARLSDASAAALVRRCALARLRAVLELELELEYNAGRLPDLEVTVSRLPRSSADVISLLELV